MPYNTKLNYAVLSLDVAWQSGKAEERYGKTLFSDSENFKSSNKVSFK